MNDASVEHLDRQSSANDRSQQVDAELVIPFTPTTGDEPITITSTGE